MKWYRDCNHDIFSGDIFKTEFIIGVFVTIYKFVVVVAGAGAGAGAGACCTLRHPPSFKQGIMNSVMKCSVGIIEGHLCVSYSYTSKVMCF